VKCNWQNVSYESGPLMINVKHCTDQAPRLRGFDGAFGRGTAATILAGTGGGGNSATAGPTAGAALYGTRPAFCMVNI